MLEPTFGGINLEDIKRAGVLRDRARRSRNACDIPVFHDDQHGTAIISAAAILNACELLDKKLDTLKVTCIGAGAAAIGCMWLWTELGVPKENITLVARKGVVHENDPNLDPYRAQFARPADDPRQTIADALVDADVMLGLAAGGIVSAEMVKTMAEKPIIFALANPDPEIPYDVAREARPDAIVGTGRSDYPNQVNNVLGFPYIFRGALDVGATHINTEMKLAAVRALAELAKEGVTDDVLLAYGGQPIKYGPEYVIPKPMDSRSLARLAPAVAEAAMKSGVAQRPLDIDKYRSELERKLDPARRVMWQVTQAARRDPRRVVFPEGEEDTILRAADILENEGIAHPVLIGRPEFIQKRAAALGVDLKGVEILDRENLPKREEYAEAFWQLRQRKGVTRKRASERMYRSRTYYSMMMLRQGDIDGVVSGLTSPYPETIRPALQVIGVADGVRRACGCYLVVAKDGVKFFADTTINIEPDAETLAETAVLVSDMARELGIEPRIAMLSFSNFGDADHPLARRVAKATRLIKEARPELKVDGEMQADVALDTSLRAAYPFSTLTDAANILIFPNLAAGNIAYKLLGAMGREIIGPVVLGTKLPVSVLQQNTSVSSIVHMTTLTVARAVKLQRATRGSDSASAS